MSDVAESQNSFFTNLTNKITYKIQEAVYDPKANQYAEKKQEQKEEEKDKIEQTKGKKDENTTVKEDPNKFSAKRIVKKTYNEMVNFLKKTFPYFLALMLAMIVTNEMIVFSVPIRIIFFIFTIYVVLTNTPLAFGLMIFYILKGGYSFFINHMTDGPKRRIMPEIYALLPITTYQPTSTLGRFFLYPFYYPKTELGAIELPEIMKDYWDSLQESFTDLDRVKTLPLFVEDIKKAKAFLDKMHLQKRPAEKPGTEGGQPTQPNSQAPPVSGNVPPANQEFPPLKPPPANGSPPLANQKPANTQSTTNKPLPSNQSSLKINEKRMNNIKTSVNSVSSVGVLSKPPEKIEQESVIKEEIKNNEGEEKKEAEVENKETAIEKKEGEVKNKEAAIEKKEGEVENKEAAIEKKEGEIENKEVIIEKKEGESDKKEATIEKKEGESEKKEATIEKKEKKEGDEIAPKPLTKDNPAADDSFVVENPIRKRTGSKTDLDKMSPPPTPKK